jgi:diguanylate cyclase (GGDEF)-like protein
MQLMYDETGNSIGIFCKSSNITERRHLKVELQKQANTDELTGVINRRHFLELANIELKRAIRLNRPMAIVMIDLDYFKLVNDKHGHAAGDKILVAFTETCRKYIREIDIFARIGGDEFALLLPETSPEQASAVVERIRIAMMSRATHIACNPLTITISSGISISESKEESLDTLMSRADKALYQAKETGRNKIVIK